MTGSHTRCSGCGIALRGHPSRGARFCTRQCQLGSAPIEWDGQTKYNDLPRLRDYWLTCMLCASETALRLSDSDARNLAPRKCPRCNGRVLLELDASKAQVPTGRRVVHGTVPMLEDVG